MTTLLDQPMPTYADLLETAAAWHTASAAARRGDLGYARAAHRTEHARGAYAAAGHAAAYRRAARSIIAAAPTDGSAARPAGGDPVFVGMHPDWSPFFAAVAYGRIRPMAARTYAVRTGGGTVRRATRPRYW